MFNARPGREAFIPFGCLRCVPSKDTGPPLATELPYLAPMVRRSGEGHNVPAEMVLRGCISASPTALA